LLQMGYYSFQQRQLLREHLLHRQQELEQSEWQQMSCQRACLTSMSVCGVTCCVPATYPGIGAAGSTSGCADSSCTNALLMAADTTTCHL
jgi:hypothetical protein